MNVKINDIIRESIAVKTTVLNDPALIEQVDRVVGLIVDRFRAGKHCGFEGGGTRFRDKLSELIWRLS